MIEVTLTPAELQECRDVGAERIKLAPGNPRFAYRKGRSGLDTHTIGCMGELAAAKVIGVPWPRRVNTFRTLPDLDPWWEVRWASNPTKAKVAIDDPPHYLVCHVSGMPPTFTVFGYILAGWVQQHIPAIDWGDQGRAAHFISQHRLTPIEPGFHSTHGWAKHDPEDPDAWACVLCGLKYEGPTS